MAAQILIIAAVLCMHLLRELEPLIPAGQNPTLSLILVGLQILFVSLLALGLKRVVLNRLAHPDKQNQPLGGFYKQLTLQLHIVLLVLFTGDIYLAGWADLATSLTRKVPILADELLTLLPLLVSWIIVQAIFYSLDRVVRLQSRPDAHSRKIWSRKQYLLFHLQVGLAPVLIPLSLLMGLIDALELLDPHLPSSLWTVAILILGLGLILLGTPVLIRFTWSCIAFKQQPIRKRLEDLCAASKLRYKNILIWRTGKMVANAAVMGFWGPLRYLLLTDALLEEMSSDELTAVFAHELGHISGHHIPYYALFLLGLNLIIYDCLERLEHFAVISQNSFSGVVLHVILLGTVFLGIFGWISRRFERDADLRAIIHSGCPEGHCQPGCPMYDLRQTEDNLTGNPRDKLCPMAIRCFTGALRRIGALNAIPLRARSWRHSSIASRTEFLYRLSCEPTQLRRFQRIIRLIKICIWAAVVAGAWGRFY